MAEFRPYMHIERYGNDEVQGIEIGELTIFPKLDGTNASIWATSVSPEEWDYRCGSRTRELTLDRDNAGFLATARETEQVGLGRRFLNFVNGHPNLRLYGEWLVPHTLKTYRDDVWKRFWVFDVFNNETDQYLSYETYKPLLEANELDYIPPLGTIKGGDYEYFIHLLKQNVFFIEDGKGIGEGIVLKNYNFTNTFGNTVWAKIINNEFKEQHHRTMGEPSHEHKVLEEEIAKQYVTEALCTKSYAKIVNSNAGWTSRLIPSLLTLVYHDVIVEEIYNIVNIKPPPTINFGVLKHYVVSQIKQCLPHLF